MSNLVEQKVGIFTPSIIDADSMESGAIQIDVSQLQRKPLSINIEYWSPEEGETKILVFVGIKEDDQIPDFNNKANFVEKATANFIEITKDGQKPIKCAATRLVSLARSQMVRGGIYEVVYTGKHKNKTNNNLSSGFECYPMSFE